MHLVDKLGDLTQVSALDLTKHAVDQGWSNVRQVFHELGEHCDHDRLTGRRRDRHALLRQLPEMRVVRIDFRELFDACPHERRDAADDDRLHDALPS